MTDEGSKFTKSQSDEHYYYIMLAKVAMDLYTVYSAVFYNQKQFQPVINNAIVVHCRYVVWEMLIGVDTSDSGHVTMSVHELGPTFDYALASLLHPFKYMCMWMNIYTSVRIRFLLQLVLIRTYTFNKEKQKYFRAIHRLNATLPVTRVTIEFLIDYC